MNLSPRLSSFHIPFIPRIVAGSWWRHQMDALLALCEGNPSVTAGFPSQRPVTRSFIFYLWCTSEQTFEQTIGTLVIWDPIALIMMLLQSDGFDWRFHTYIVSSVSYVSVYKSPDVIVDASWCRVWQGVIIMAVEFASLLWHRAPLINAGGTIIELSSVKISLIHPSHANWSHLFLWPWGKNSQHFADYIFNCNFINGDYCFSMNCSKVCFQRSNWDMNNSGNGSVPSRRQSITWTNDVADHWCLYASPKNNGLLV